MLHTYAWNTGSYNGPQTVKSNKVGFISIGEKACSIMVTVVRKVNAAEQPGRQTNMSSLRKECDDLRQYVRSYVSGILVHML
jgi:hypothetical protein